jgi:hypothetical protein
VRQSVGRRPGASLLELRNLGHSRNWNRSLCLARGRLIKFLCAHDVLYPRCLEAMVPLFEARSSIGLAFSRRDVELETPDHPAALAWRAKHLCPHEVFGGDLDDVNSGPALVRRWAADGFDRNAVGEPTNVMMARECLQDVGTFNVRIRQRADMELWLRAMTSYDIGFVDRPLARYFVRSGSVTSVNRAASLSWMDNLWLFEGLRAYEPTQAGQPEFRALRRRAARRCIRHAIRSATRGDWGRLRALLDYAEFRLRGRDPNRLCGTLDEEIPPHETPLESTRAGTS